MTPTTKTVLPLVLGAISRCTAAGTRTTARLAERAGRRKPGRVSDGADNDSVGSYDCDDSDCAGHPTVLTREATRTARLMPTRLSQWTPMGTVI